MSSSNAHPRQKRLGRKMSNFLILAILLSLLIHAVALFFIFRTRIPQFTEPPLVIDIEPPAFLESKEQIISPTQQKPAETPPPETKNLSDTNLSTLKEQVNKREPGAPAPPSQNDQQPAQPPKPQPQQPQTQHQQSEKPAQTKPQPVHQHEPKSDFKSHTEEHSDEESTPKHASHTHPLDMMLKLDPQTAASRFGAEPKPDVTSQSLTQKIQGVGPVSLGSYRAFSRPSGSGARFAGQGGTSDFLPNLPDGDITLLNAKASTYASFVRRVAIQVFGALRSSGWERLTHRDITALSNYSVVRAILSKKGDLMRVELLEKSGSALFDDTLVEAGKKGARDPNPPAGAEASDGTIRFIFQARSWSEVGASASSGAMSERRWLLLATGLE